MEIPAGIWRTMGTKTLMFSFVGSIRAGMGLFSSSGSAGRFAALELSANGVGLASVSRSGAAPAVLDVCEYVEVPERGSVGDVLGRLARRHRLGRRDCSIVIEAGAYTLLLVEAPDVPPEELRAAVRWRVRELIDFHIDDAVIDVFDIPAQRAGGRTRMMYVVAARVPRVGEKAELARTAGLRLRVIDIPELAQRNIAATLPEDVAGVALMHVAEGSGLITLTRQGTLYLARRFDLGAPGAAGGAESPPVREWLDELVVQIQRSLDYFESSFAQTPISNLVIAPMAAPVPGVDEYLAAQLGLSVRMLDLNEVIDSREPIAAALQAQCFSALGAALRNEGVSL